VFLAATFLIALAPAPTFAQVIYEQEVNVPGNIAPVLANVQTPTSPSAPLYNPALDPAQYLNSSNAYYQYTSSSISSPMSFPTAVILDRLSMVATVGLGTSKPRLYIMSDLLQQLFTYDLTTSLVQSPSPLLGFVNNEFDSLAASQSGGVTIMADHLGWSVDPVTGTGTQIFNANGGGTAPGQFSNALYQDYGPTGLLYILDYGNQRVQALDPANAFAPVSQFSLQSGLANMPFAIAPNGSFYFGDGNGGGQAYLADGTYEGAFTSPVSSSIPGLSNQPYLNADGKGDVFVFDSTGAHQFLDTSAVPEPSMWIMFVLGLVGLFALRQRSPSRQA